jgi:hypothetical protein
MTDKLSSDEIPEERIQIPDLGLCRTKGCGRTADDTGYCRQCLIMLRAMDKRGW